MRLTLEIRWHQCDAGGVQVTINNQAYKVVEELGSHCPVNVSLEPVQPRGVSRREALKRLVLPLVLVEMLANKVRASGCK